MPKKAYSNKTTVKNKPAKQKTAKKPVKKSASNGNNSARGNSGTRKLRP